jgi:hypothetical protein
MEKGYPERYHILPSLGDVARFVGRLLTPYPTEAPPYMSNHYRGASCPDFVEQPELPFDEASK